MPTVRFVEPAEGVPIFDQVEVVVEVAGGERPMRVELTVDGRSAAVQSPDAAGRVRFRIDVGGENVARMLEATVIDGSGARSAARRVAPAVAVDEALDLGLRQLYVTVTDRQGRRVLGLERAAFSVRDEGVAEELVTFEGGDIPFTAAILVDGSASMEGERLATALAGARRFVEGMRPLDEAQLLVVSDRLLAATPWSRHDDQRLAAQLADIEASGGTALFDHLYLALSAVEDRQGRRVVILLSDGWDLHSALRAEQVAQAARRSRAIVYWLRTGTEPRVQKRFERFEQRRRDRGLDATRVPESSWRRVDDSKKEFETLERLVESTGGRILDVGDVSGAAEAFADILAELREQYALGYYPTDRRRDGSWREAQVVVRGDDLSWRTREGYVDR